jgi:hypothetical protein
MNRRILSVVATGVLVAMSCTAVAFACDKDAKTSAAAVSSKGSTCTAEMAAKCTPAQMAACKAKGASAATAASCAAHASAAITASADHCAGKGVSATTAVSQSRGKVNAVAASSDCCKSKSKGVSAAAAGANCSNKVNASAAGGYSCGGKGMTGAMSRSGHGDCDACADMTDCDGELKNTGALTQVVRLKNGVMFVYTAQDPSKVHAVQAAVTQRNDRLVAINAAGDKAKLCPECKTMRGAIASGKLSREMVTIEGGCLTIVTSSDRALVGKLHTMVAEHTSARGKI